MLELMADLRHESAIQPPRINLYPEDAKGTGDLLNRLIKRGGALDLQEVAVVYFTLGDNERGFQWLTKAFDQRSGYIPWAAVNPKFDGIRSDPRFKALVARLKLPTEHAG